MSRSRTQHTTPGHVADLAFLLSQVGSHSSIRFADRLEPLGFKPMHVGVLRVVAQCDGLSQQALGETLGVFPSRLVSVLDDLEGRGLVERRNSPTDRRTYALLVTESGREALEQIGLISRELQESICAPLDERERVQLADLLRRVADEQGLKPGIHPAMRKMGGDAK